MPRSETPSALENPATDEKLGTSRCRRERRDQKDDEEDGDLPIEHLLLLLCPDALIFEEKIKER